MNKILDVLNEKGITQYKLAKGIGRPRQTINSVCLNINQPRLGLLFEIAKFLGVKPADLLGDGSEITAEKKGR
jgi:transcriptional regulator with XRE-family HTH domain